MQLTTEELTVIFVAFCVLDLANFVLRIVREKYLKKHLKAQEERHDALVERHNNLMNELWGVKEGYKQLMEAQNKTTTRLQGRDLYRAEEEKVRRGQPNVWK